jgi:hypothetical protein
MNRISEYIVENMRAFRIAFFYVGLGTLAVCSVYPDDVFSGSWAVFGIAITFPVCIISFGYRYAEAHTLYPVFIIQFVMFILTFLVLSSWFRKAEER